MASSQVSSSSLLSSHEEVLVDTPRARMEVLKRHQLFPFPSTSDFVRTQNELKDDTDRRVLLGLARAAIQHSKQDVLGGIKSDSGKLRELIALAGIRDQEFIKDILELLKAQNALIQKSLDFFKDQNIVFTLPEEQGNEIRTETQKLAARLEQLKKLSADREEMRERAELVQKSISEDRSVEKVTAALLQHEEDKAPEVQNLEVQIENLTTEIEKDLNSAVALQELLHKTYRGAVSLSQFETFIHSFDEEKKKQEELDLLRKTREAEELAFLQQKEQEIDAQQEQITLNEAKRQKLADEKRSLLNHTIAIEREINRLRTEMQTARSKGEIEGFQTMLLLQEESLKYVLEVAELREVEQEYERVMAQMEEKAASTIRSLNEALVLAKEHSGAGNGASKDTGFQVANESVLQEVLDISQIETPVEDAKQPGDIDLLLKWVVEGEQAEAERLLKDNSKSIFLVFDKATITDMSKRTFDGISPFQYALWALDEHMWRMFITCIEALPQKEVMQAFSQAKTQFEELQSNGTTHGVYFDLTQLIEALDIFIAHHDTWSPPERDAHWAMQVGGAQALLPAHVINEYCHPSRPFAPCPDFAVNPLPRSRQIAGGEWFKMIQKDGSRLAILRSNYSSAMAMKGSAARKWDPDHVGILSDCEALRNLLRVRRRNFFGLKLELTRN